MNTVATEMIKYYAGDKKRINHFIKVHGYAKAIGEAEGLDERTMLILETAAYVHDIGIKISEEKYNSSAGKYQEIEGPPIAEEMLTKLRYNKDVIERVSYLVAHHHTYSNIDGIDYQILVEADFLVNIDEDEMTKETAKNVREKIFKTKSGTQMLDNLFFNGADKIMWIGLVCLYGVLKGIRDIIKKKAMEKNSAMEVLFFYTFISFLFVTPSMKNALSIDFHYIGFVMIKSAIIFIAWICSFKAIKKLPIGFYGIMDMSRVIFATVLGVTVLGEVMTGHKIAGMALVLVGLLFVNAKGKGVGEEKTKPIYIVLVLISCLCNAVSELLDKMLMQSMNSGQLQFWYMFFMVILYLGYMIVTKTKIDFRTIYKNYWILILSVLFVIGDKALFIACSKQESTVVAMTLIKQCSVMITIIGGRIVFKEKRTLYKMVCAAVIIAGIVFAVM